MRHALLNPKLLRTFHICLPFLNPKPQTLAFHFHSSLSTSTPSHFLIQFSPFRDSVVLDGVLNANERRKIILKISNLIKVNSSGLILRFSESFCPIELAEIMMFLDSRDTAFAFFKFAAQDFSASFVVMYCTAARLLMAERFYLMAQDLLTWVVKNVGASRSMEVIKGMEVRRIGDDVVSEFYVFDSVMRALMGADMGLEALKVLGRMRGMGFVPSVSSISILFKLLLRVGDYGSVWKIFGDLVRKGPLPTNVMFNSMMIGLCRGGFVNVAGSLLQVMHKYGCFPDTISYNIVINSCCVNGRSWDGLRWVNTMMVNGCDPSTYTLSTVINALCKEGNMVEARRVFDKLREFHVQPNTIIYNALLNGYVKARDIEQACILFEDMQLNGIAPDCATVNTLVVGHYRYGKAADGNKFLNGLSHSDLLADNVLLDVSISGLCWVGRLDEAMQLLLDMLEKGMPLSIYSFNSVIATYSRAGLVSSAFKAYKLMVEYGFFPSNSTCSSLLIGVCRMGWLQKAWQLIEKMMLKGLYVNKMPFTILIDAHFREGNVTDALNLWTEMKRRGIFPDAITFSAFINGLCKAGLVEDAYDVLSEMLQIGFVPNNFTYNSLIGGLCDVGKLNEAVRVKEEMCQRGLIPDIFTINIIINGFCRVGRMRSAMNMFMDMYRTGMTPDIVTYNTLLSAYCKEFDLINADSVISKMHASGWAPDITTYNICINTFCSSRRINQAVMILNKLILVGVVPNTVTYNTMLNGICGDVLDRAMIVTGKLLKTGFAPNIVTTNVVLSHIRRQGMPQKTLTWGQKLSQIGIVFDCVTHKIMDQAHRDLQENIESSVEESEKSLFLDFLMYLTYEHFSRNMHQHYRLQFEPSGGSQEVSLHLYYLFAVRIASVPANYVNQIRPLLLSAWLPRCNMYLVQKDQIPAISLAVKSPLITCQLASPKTPCGVFCYKRPMKPFRCWSTCLQFLSNSQALIDHKYVARLLSDGLAVLDNWHEHNQDCWCKYLRANYKIPPAQTRNSSCTTRPI